jgi:hypothetical protein
MPGMIVVDQQATFSSPPLVMSVGPKLKFNSDQQDINRNGERKWVCQVAVSYSAEAGMRSMAEVIEVGLVGMDPSTIVQAGMPVQFDRLRTSVTAPEKTDEGRVRGGRLFWMADAVRPFSGAGNGHPVTAGAKAD